MLEKALYEIFYEAANRPGWVGVPIAGALALIDGDDDGDMFAEPAGDDAAQP